LILPPSSPWRARLAALAGGLAAGFAHPPFGLIVGILGYGLWLWSTEAPSPRPLRSAFFRGWLAGVGYFAVGVWWIAEAFLVDVAAHGWMAPFAVLMLAGGLALFWGLAGLLHQLARPRGAWRVLVFAGCVALAEWLRGHVFTGFPWNLPGETWRAGDLVSQSASVLGAYGLSWVTVALGAAPAVLFGPVGKRGRYVGFALTSAALAGLLSFGALRLSQAPAAAADAPRVVIVQANIDQKEKWRPENLDQIVTTYLRLSQRVPDADLVVWPEGALPAVIDDLLAPGSPYVGRFVRALHPGQTLLMGANRAGLSPAGGVDYFNSLVALRREPEGLKVTGVYDKHRLVPFGEFLPFGDLATRLGIRSLVHMPEDFTAGPPPAPLRLEGAPPVQPLICYEALFPRMASEGAQRAGFRAQWLLNVSNDAWFGATSGPWQHLNIASYRAIEEGLPIVRATPTGVSAMIDAFGRIAPGAKLDLGAADIIDARLPPALPPTLYARWGDWPFVGMLALSGILALSGFHRRVKN
jgi:apolipoprotein N-acyltransferase